MTQQIVDPAPDPPRTAASSQPKQGTGEEQCVTDRKGERRSRFKSYFAVGVAQGLRAGQAIAVAVMLARGFSKDEFGEIGYAMALSALFLPIFEFGSRTILVREFSRHGPHVRQWLSTAIQAKVLLAIGICLVSYLTSKILDEGSIPRLTFLFSLSYLFRCLEPYELWAMAQRNFAIPAMARAVGFCVAIACLLTGILFYKSLDATAFLYALSFAAYSLTVWLLTVRHCSPPAFQWRVDLSTLKMQFTEALPLMLSAIAINIYMRLDTLMLKPIHGISAVATYLAASRISQGLYMIPTVLIDATFPTLARIDANSPESRRKWQETMDTQVAAALGLAILSIMAAPMLMRTIFGAGYSESINVFRIHAASLLFVATGQVSSRYLAAHHRQSLTLAATLTGLFSNLLLNIVLIPKYSYYGASVATCVSYFCATFIIYAAIPSAHDLVHMQLKAVLGSVTTPYRKLRRHWGGRPGVPRGKRTETLQFSAQQKVSRDD